MPTATGYAYLEGGKCDKTRHRITSAEADEGVLACKGGLYRFGDYGQRSNGDIIAKYAGPVTQTGTGVKAAHAHQGYADIQRSVNTVMPVSLSNARHSTSAALRKLERARKIKIG